MALRDWLPPRGPTKFEWVLIVGLLLEIAINLHGVYLDLQSWGWIGP